MSKILDVTEKQVLRGYCLKICELAHHKPEERECKHTHGSAPVSPKVKYFLFVFYRRPAEQDSARRNHSYRDEPPRRHAAIGEKILTAGAREAPEYTAQQGQSDAEDGVFR